MKQVICLAIIGLFIIGVLGVSLALDTQAVNVGNKICPISGEKISEKTKATYEHDDKIYNFCCPMCIDTFKKDPEKYINKVNEELKESAKEESSEGGSMEMPMGMHEGH